MEDVFDIKDGVLNGYHGPGGDVVVPDGVISLSLTAFWGNCSPIRSIRLPEGVRRMDAKLRRCHQLTTVYLPKSVTRIGLDVFENCPALTEIVIEPGNQNFKIVDGMLLNKQTLLWCPSGKSGTVVVPDGIKRITNYTFSGCGKITELIFPDSVTQIGADAFYDCRSLRRVVLPKNLPRLCKGAFQGCAALEEVVLPESLTQLPKYAFSNSGLRRVTLPENIQEVCSCAFWNCAQLEEVTMVSPEIGAYVFGECNKLRCLTVLGTPRLTPAMFPESLETVIADAIPPSDLPRGPIKDAAVVTFARRFRNGENPPQCEAYLSYIKKQHRHLLPLAAGHEDLLRLMLSEKLVTSKDVQTLLQLTEQNIPLKAEILEYQDKNGGPPDPFAELEAEMARAERTAAYIERTGKLPVSELKKIWSWKKREDGTLCVTAYKGTDTEIIVPDKIGRTAVTAIATSFLVRNEGVRNTVTAVTLPEGLTCIEKQAFSLCQSLKTIHIPAGVTKIEDFTFRNCSSLTEIVLPEGVTEIGAHAFESSGLKHIFIPASVKKIGSWCFTGCKNLAVHAPAGSYAEGYAIRLSLCPPTK